MVRAPSLSELLKARLATLQVDQTTAAAQMGVSATTFSRWINGKDMPQPKRIEPLADWLDMPVNELLRIVYAGRGEDPARVEAAMAALTEEVAELKELLKRLLPPDEDA